MWVPPEDHDPVLLHAPTRKSVAVFGAVRVEDGRLTIRISQKFNASTFQLFLQQLLRGSSRVCVGDLMRIMTVSEPGQRHGEHLQS